MQKGQGVIHTQRKKEILGSSDAQVALNRRLLKRELKALAEGRPLKEWRYIETEVPIDPMGQPTAELQSGVDREVKAEG